MTKAKTNTTKETILKTAGSLFSQRGYFGVSMQDIADELSITKAALYYHFESKESLTEELLRGTIDELKQELKHACEAGMLPSDKVFNMVKTFLDFKIHHPELSLLVSLGFTSDEKEPLVQFVQDLRIELTKFIRELIGGIDFLRRITYKGLFLLTTSLLGLVLSPFQNTNNKDIAQDFTDLLLSGTGKKGKN
ncbi:MAG: hypothetical protein COY85_01120 [Candidatus Portnoybacteria bacterium CG_4_10_14_0_8_um_filter_40_50]|uniref:HTH tetR-type domain-containing protein n=1 Tax=Candidatus Portnoybacteria bacterium CG_4_10_14_0_8_um_filter_40_50 TaxID=1974800 RepID=A0A2M7QS83_9BACT|nr:MAG: hypothetical protein COY85_01120 [Candidatus Portnoybacteria bacterium CG_4_10_14_0_8_um_filter_40_50]